MIKIPGRATFHFKVVADGVLISCSNSLLRKGRGVRELWAAKRRRLAWPAIIPHCVTQTFTRG